MRIEYERADEPNLIGPGEIFACFLFLLGIFLMIFGCPIIGMALGGL